MRLLASLSHPGLVTLFDAGKDDAGRDDGEAGEPRAFLVMELIDGPDLRKRLRECERLESAEAAYVGAELAGALAYIHGRGVIHRDVKPANILLPPAVAGTLPRAKLTDFGIARMIDGARITAANATLGTANYLSPEQASAQEVGPSSDIYSLGLVLLECVTGRIEFGGSAVEAAVARLSRDPDIPGYLGHHWQTLLTGMTARDPDQRPTAAEVSAALLEHRWNSLSDAGENDAVSVDAAAPGTVNCQAWRGTATYATDDSGASTADQGRAGPVRVAPGRVGPGIVGPGPEAQPAPPQPLAVVHFQARQEHQEHQEQIRQEQVREERRPSAVSSAASSEASPAAPSPMASPPAAPPRIGPAQQLPARTAGQQGELTNGARITAPGPSRLALAGRTLLAVVAMTVLTIAVILVAERLGIFPEGGRAYPPVPGQLGQHLQELQESVNP